MKDAYVAINADYRLRRQGPEGAAYGYPLHRINQLRYLCAAYADIDFYKLGLSWSEALGHDPDDVASAPGAFPEKLEMYYRLQREIVGRLAGVGADACATDAARHLRVPDSLHTGADEQVKWWLHGTGASLHSYSLAELPASLLSPSDELPSYIAHYPEVGGRKMGAALATPARPLKSAACGLVQQIYRD